MKNVPVLVSREESGEYKHTPLPTDGEVTTIILSLLLYLSLLLQPELNIVASFDRRGDRVVTGSSKGKVCGALG